MTRRKLGTILLVRSLVQSLISHPSLAKQLVMIVQLRT